MAEFKDGTARQMNTINGFVRIQLSRLFTSGRRHDVGLRDDGRLAAWGNNDCGQTDVPEGDLYGDCG